jgi:hypothetical protein
MLLFLSLVLAVLLLIPRGPRGGRRVPVPAYWVQLGQRSFGSDPSMPPCSISEGGVKRGLGG